MSPLVIELLSEAMAREPGARGFVLDGFPANLEQARIIVGMPV